MNKTINTLRGVTVLVTRPAVLAKQLAKKIEQCGGRSIIYPAISIETPDNPKQRDQLLQQLEHYDIAIFISPTAVTKTFEQITSLPSTLQVAAIGSSTEQSLKHYKIPVTIKPDGHNSESLLHHSRLQAEQINGKAIVIFRGEGGRELLGDTLQSRGAAVSYAEMYKRVKPSNAISLTRDELNTINIITTTSNEGLQNLFDMTENKSLLTQKPLLVPGNRTKKLAEKLGFTEIILSESATDAACIDALNTWAN
jgi:uroporphyrinogen-III synthase